MKNNSGRKNDTEIKIVDPRILKPALGSAFDATPPEAFPCGVCGAPGATHQSDDLCWVCQRLKISAWKESENQVVLAE